MGIVTVWSITAAVVLIALLAGLEAQSLQGRVVSRSDFPPGKAQEFYNYEDSNSESSDVTLVDSHNLKYKVDTAKITISVTPPAKDNKLASPVDIYFLSDYCHTCAYYNVTSITGAHQHYNSTFLVDSRWKSNLRIIANYTHSKDNCNVTRSFQFKERASYTLQVIITDEVNKTKCSVGEITGQTDPFRTNLPIAVAAAMLLGLCIAYTLVDRFYSKRTEDRYGSVERFINSDLGSTGDIVDHPPTPPPRPARERHAAVDCFRGICIVIMVFVNYKGGKYWFFHHSPWHGLTVADLVFPWFMFIMGINIVLSIDSLIRKATPSWEIAYKIIRRTLILFFLGLCIINHNTDFENMRIPGVLQRFAVAYCIVTFLQWGFHKPVPDLTTKVVMETSDEGVKPWWYHFRDITIYWPQWIFIALFEVTWHCLTFLLKVPGCPTGYLGPGGLAEYGENFHCIGGAAGYIDRKVFGKKHMYGGPTAKIVYYTPDYVKDNNIPFDPEGILGSFHSIFIVFLGLQAGKIFLYYKEPKGRIIRWLAWSLLLGVISAILTKCSQFDGWIPVNKNLWTTTFVTTLSCFAFFLLSALYYIIDVKKWYTGVPFNFVGMNSIFIYVGHEVFEGYLPFAWGAGNTSTHTELLAMNMWGTACWVIIAYYCYKIKFFVKI